MRRTHTRFGSLLLVMAMLLTLMPISAMAVEGSAYDALTTAIAAAPTDGTETVVTLTDDITDMTTEQIITIEAGQNIVLDMDEHSIAVDANFAGRPIKNQGTLTVTGNGTIDSSASNTGGYGAIDNYGTLTIENGTYTGSVNASGASIRNRPDCTLTIKNGTFNGAPTAVYNEGTTTIYNGYFDCHSCSACNSNSWGYTIQSHWNDKSAEKPELYFYDGTVIGVQGAFSTSAGYSEVHDGIFETVACSEHGTSSAWYALYIAGESGVVESHIYGGTFNSASRVAAYIGNTNDGGEKKDAIVYIHDGTFISNDSAQIVNVAEPIGGLTIFGGKFEGNGSIDTYVDPSSKLTKTEEGKYEVAPIPETDGVAEIDGKYYKSLGDAIASASNGDTVRLLEDISGDFTIDKPITIDGQNQFTITGTIEVRNGTLKNMTLTNNPGQQILTIGSTEQNTIRMEGVTVKYPVEGEDMKTLSHILNGNNANITITGCTFMNEANNGGVTEGAAQWSYGMYMNGQGANGSFTMTNSRFDGAFRTMLANINGTVTISENTFANSIYSNNSGSTSGSGEEATCITTADADVSGISIVNNTFDNAGAFYFQESQGAAVTGNVFKFDKFEHYIQLRDDAADPLDLTDNTFEMGENDLVIVDVAAAPVKLPTGQKAVSYYAWADTAEAARPNDYSTYVYAYNADGSRTFYPESDAALNAFLNPTCDRNVGVGSGDTVEIHQNLNLSDDATIPADAVLVIDSSATLTVPEGVTLTNNGTIVNPEQISGAVTSGETAAVKQTVKFQVTPSNAQVVVKDQSGAVVVPEENNLYYLADGSYTYTVSAQNYYEQSGTFVVSGQAQTINVVLTEIPSSGGAGEPVTPTGDYLVNVDRTTGGKVTVTPGRADKGDTVTITVKPSDGYVLDELTVTAKEGGSVKLTWKDDNKYTFTMPGSQVTVEATFVKEVGQTTTDLPFTDVTTSDWYYDAVEYVYENDLMNGTSATAFSPFMTTSRAMILTILARYDGVDTSTGSTWYEAGAVWAIAEGVSDGTNLEANLTREQLVTMLWRYAGSPAAAGDLSGYPDGASVSDWAAEAMLWAVDSGIITGNEAGALNPQGTATRAEVATILMRYLEN